MIGGFRLLPYLTEAVAAFLGSLRSSKKMTEALHNAQEEKSCRSSKEFEVSAMVFDLKRCTGFVCLSVC